MKNLAIVFDLGGVVLNNGAYRFASEISRKSSLNTKKVYRKILEYAHDLDSGKISEKQFFTKLSDEFNLSDNYNREKYLDYYSINKKVLNLVIKLKKNYKVGLLSNISFVQWKYFNNKYKLSKIFDFLILSYKVGFAKPNKNIYLEIFKKSNDNKHIYIDDISEYLIPAKELGIITIHFKDYNSLVKDLKANKINI